jgi:hypothetical protein
MHSIYFEFTQNKSTLILTLNFEFKHTQKKDNDNSNITQKKLIMVKLHSTNSYNISFFFQRILILSADN